MAEGLKRWFAEKWTNQKGDPCGSGTTRGTPKCRPSKRVTSGTPKTWSELSESQKKRAIADKQKVGHRTSKVRFSKLKKKLNK
ncbi:hypothetical protein EBZ38_05920 [bacterium]|nr:hypothetical protein [bacterium]NDG28324.1 hypothetical protein [Pseudomonadota bacterium]